METSQISTTACRIADHGYDCAAPGLGNGVGMQEDRVFGNGGFDRDVPGLADHRLERLGPIEYRSSTGRTTRPRRSALQDDLLFVDLDRVDHPSCDDPGGRVRVSRRVAPPGSVLTG